MAHVRRDPAVTARIRAMTAPWQGTPELRARVSKPATTLRWYASAPLRKDRR